jgi:hypothetical protein
MKAGARWGVGLFAFIWMQEVYHGTLQTLTFDPMLKAPSLMQAAGQSWSRWFFLLGLIGILLPSAVSGARVLDVLHSIQGTRPEGALTGDESEGLHGFHMLLAELSEASEEVEVAEDEGGIPSLCRLVHDLSGDETARDLRTAHAVARTRHLERLAIAPRAYLLYQTWKIHPLAEQAGE